MSVRRIRIHGLFAGNLGIVRDRFDVLFHAGTCDRTYMLAKNKLLFHLAFVLTSLPLPSCPHENPWQCMSCSVSPPGYGTTCPFIYYLRSVQHKSVLVVTGVLVGTVGKATVSFCYRPNTGGRGASSKQQCRRLGSSLQNRFLCFVRVKPRDGFSALVRSFGGWWDNNNHLDGYLLRHIRSVRIRLA